MKATQAVDNASKIPLLAEAIKAWTPEDGRENLSIALNNMGCNLLDVHRDAEALSFFQKGLEIVPHDPSMLLGSATALSRLFRAPQALPFLDAAYRADPTWAAAAEFSCTLRIKLELYADALPFCEEAVRRAGPSVMGYQHLAEAYAFLGRSAEAEQALAISVKSPSKFNYPAADAAIYYAADARIAEAVVRGWGREPERGEALFDALISDYPAKADFIILRGRLYLHLGRFDRAIRDFNSVLELDPKDTEGLVFRAEAEARSGRAQSAAADLASACRAGWTTACPSAKIKK